MGGKRKPKGGKVASTGTSTPAGGRFEATGSRRKTNSPLPSRYEFIPPTKTPTAPPFAPSTSARLTVKDYPPPGSLFQHSEPTPRTSPLSDGRRSPSFQGQNSHTSEPPHSDGEEHSTDERALCTGSLAEDQQRILTALLTKPGREEYTTELSPTPKPGTTWFGRDKSSLTRKITKIFTNKFDGPYYSWKCVPRDRQERYFVEFAKTHTWDPLITGLVQENFEKVCKRRMKDMVSTARTSRERPRWIKDSLWTKMTKN